MVNNNVGIVIQARTTSTRLPGKVLMELPSNSGITVLDHIINRSNLISNANKVIVATTVNSTDNIIEKKYRNIVYRGSEKDVLGRYYKIAKKYSFNHVVRLTGDNPCIDYKLLEKVIDTHIKDKNNYTFTKGLPLGMNLEIMTFEALETAFNKAISNSEREHVTLYFKKSKNFKKSVLQFGNESSLSDIRTTIDYASDYAFLNLLFLNLKENFLLKDIIKYISHNKWVLEINKGNYQKKVFYNIND